MTIEGRTDWGNLELDLTPIPPATPEQKRAAQRTVCSWAPDPATAAVLLDALGLRERISA